MDFQDTQDEAAFRAEARAWLDKHEIKGWQEAIQAGEDAVFAAAREWQKLKASGGWACLSWPKDYGGRGASAIERYIWAQEEGDIAMLSMPFLIGHAMVGPTLIAYATEDQKRRYLPPLARGEEIWCQLFSEPNAGSDLAAVRTRAVRDGDDWLISGQKVWTSFAHRSDYAILIARSDPEQPKHKGLTFFFLDMKSPGISVRPIRQITGDAEFNEVFFDTVRVPDSQRLGDVGRGWEVALTTLMNERAHGSVAFTPMLEEMFELANMTQLDDRPAIEHDSVRDRLADWYVRVSGLKYAELRTLTSLSRGQEPGPESSITKLVAAKNRQDMSSLMLDILDQAGVIWRDQSALNGTFQYQFFRTAANRIEAGTDEILRNIIAERVLGMPPEIRTDKDGPFRDIATP